MYRLTLSREERKAIDWIGHRYFHGDNLYSLLISCRLIPDFAAWDDDDLIAFDIPEHIAWEIKFGIESEDSFLACFDSSLKSKLIAFIDSIV